MNRNYEIIQMDAQTWRIENEQIVRFFLLTGSESALLIDTGMMTPNAREIAESLTKLPLQLLNTHADPDHICGNAAFEVAMMHKAEEENFRQHGGTCKIREICEGDVIDLGNRPLKVIELPGHTPGSIGLVDINNRVLYSGDTVQDGRIFMFKAHRNLKKYLETMERLANMKQEFDLIYPSHGTIPLQPQHVDRLQEAAKMILEGKAEYQPANVFGAPVAAYGFDCAVFLCDMPQG